VQFPELGSDGGKNDGERVMAVPPYPWVLINPQTMPEELRGLAYEEIHVPRGEVWCVDEAGLHRFRLATPAIIGASE